MPLNPRSTRTYLRLLQGAGLIAFFLSVVGWAGVSVQRLLMLVNGQALPFGTSPLIQFLFILEGMKEAATPLLLAGILIAVCHIALQLTPDTTPPAED